MGRPWRSVVSAMRSLEAACDTRDEFLVLAGSISAGVGPRLPMELLEVTGLDEASLRSEIEAAQSRWKARAPK